MAHRGRDVACAAALLLHAGCGAPDQDAPGFVLLGPSAADAGFALRVNGRVCRAGWPVAVTADDEVLVMGADGVDRLAVERGSLVEVLGPNGRTEASSAEDARLVLSADVDTARRWSAAWGIALKPVPLAARPSWLLEGPLVLELASLEKPEEAMWIEPWMDSDDLQTDDGYAELDWPTGAALDVDGRRALEAGLAVELQLDARRVFEVGEHISAIATLVNRSAHVVFWVVAPSDGSADGRREPSVFFTGEWLSASGWQAIDRRASRRWCGNFDEAWDRSVVALLPGDSLPLAYFDAPDERLELDHPGRVRLQAHYRYGAGAHTLAPSVRIGDELVQVGDLPRALPAELVHTAAFEVVSEPVEVSLVRPLELEATAVAPLRRHVRTPLASLVDVALVSSNPAELDIVGARGGLFQGFRSLHVEVAPSSAGILSDDERAADLLPSLQLGPGERRAIDDHLGTTIEVVDETVRSIRIRVGLDAEVSSQGTKGRPSRRELRSTWIEIGVL